MDTQLTQTMSFSFTLPEFIQNPYPVYEEMRSVGPIIWGSFFKYRGWYVTGYEEAIAILKDPRFKNRIPLPLTTKKYEQLRNLQSDMLLYKNEADHKRLRGLISHAFTPKITERYRPFIEESVYDLLHNVKHKQKFDIVSEFAFPLASLVIAAILGVPAADRLQFREWTQCLIKTIDFSRSPLSLANGNDTSKQIIHYFSDLISRRKSNPQNDLISMLIMEEQHGDKLTDEELLATCILLIIAGHETTVNLISNATLSLLKHPKQRAQLRANPLLTETAVEEFLRFESPTQLTARTAAEDIDLNGVCIKAGEQVYIFLGAANRDPNKFSQANMLDITRNPNPHLAFGYGSHFCIGSALARLEAQIAIQTLLERLPNIQIAVSDPKWRALFGFRSLSELPVNLN